MLSIADISQYIHITTRVVHRNICDYQNLNWKNWCYFYKMVTQKTCASLKKTRSYLRILSIGANTFIRSNPWIQCKQGTYTSVSIYYKLVYDKNKYIKSYSSAKQCAQYRMTFENPRGKVRNARNHLIFIVYIGKLREKKYDIYHLYFYI